MITTVEGTERETFYKVVSGEVLEWCRGYRERYDTARMAAGQLAQKLGAERYFQGFHGYVIGFSWDDDNKVPEGFTKPKRGGLRTPLKSTIGGRQQQALIDKLPRFPVDQQFLTLFQYPRALDCVDTEGNNCVVHSNMTMVGGCQVLWNGTQYWLRLPNIEYMTAVAEKNNWTVVDAPLHVPDGMVAQTREHYELDAAEWALKVKQGQVDG